MFNRTSVSQSAHVTINQQPHNAADAARLFGEIEDKVSSKIKSSICKQIEGINAQYVQLETHRLPHEWQDRYQIVFRLNGRPCEVEVFVGDQERNEIDFKVLAKIADAITCEVLKLLAPQLYAHSINLRKVGA